MKKTLWVVIFLLVMAGFNSGNIFAQGIGGSIASLLMEAGGGGRVASNSGVVIGTWSSPYTDAVNATDGDYSTYAFGSTSHDNSGENKESCVTWDMGVVSDISIITVKADITGTPYGSLFIRVSQDGIFWTDLGFQIGIYSSPLQKERTILCPYRIQYIQVVSRTAYTDPSNIYIHELTVR